MDKTCIGIATAAASTPAAAGALQSAEPAAEKSPARSAVLALVCLLRVGVIALMASSIAPSVWRARGDPWELALAAGPCALLAAIFVCLHRAKRLTPDSQPGERWRLQFAVWVLSTGIFCMLAYRTSLGMPAAVVTVIWCMTSFVVLAFIYMLVFYRGQQYQRVDEVNTDAGGEDKPKKKTRTADELV